VLFNILLFFLEERVSSTGINHINPTVSYLIHKFLRPVNYQQDQYQYLEYNLQHLFSNVDF